MSPSRLGVGERGAQNRAQEGEGLQTQTAQQVGQRENAEPGCEIGFLGQGTWSSTPHFHTCCQRSVALIPGARSGSGGPRMWIKSCRAAALAVAAHVGPISGKLQFSGPRCTLRCLDRTYCCPRTAGHMERGGGVSGEDNPWFLTGQLAYSEVPMSLLRGSCDQY